MKQALFANICALTFGTAAFAQTDTAAYSNENVLAENTLPKVKGLIRRVTPATNTLTIKADEIPNLQMPPMTMDFPVKDAAMMTGLKAGDKILFSADEINGEVVVVWLEKQP